MTIAVLGAGRMGSVAAEQLPEDVKKIIIDQDAETAQRIADRIGGSASQDYAALSDADMVLLLRRPCKYPGSPDSDQPNLAIVDVAKNRNGATGEVNLNFDGNITRFSDYAFGPDRDNPAAL